MGNCLDQRPQLEFVVGFVGPGMGGRYGWGSDLRPISTKSVTFCPPYRPITKQE
jgi:hypothetical protein